MNNLSDLYLCRQKKPIYTSCYTRISNLTCRFIQPNPLVETINIKKRFLFREFVINKVPDFAKLFFL